MVFENPFFCRQGCQDQEIVTLVSIEMLKTVRMSCITLYIHSTYEAKSSSWVYQKIHKHNADRKPQILMDIPMLP
jgi:hypothetical protein